MLRGISPLISPELLSLLSRMGHGDEIVIADANFPGETICKQVLRADGVSASDLLDAILLLFPIDEYVKDPVVMMQPVAGDTADPALEASYEASVKKHSPKAPGIKKIERFAFYDRAKLAFAAVITGETRKYGNIIIKKGVVIQ